MSALNAFVTPDCVHLFTDGGQYNPSTMALEGIAPKVAIFPQHNAVLGSTGYSFIFEAMLHSINGAGFSGYDAMVAEFESFLPKTIAFWATMPGAPKDWGLFNIVIAGWSERENAPTAHVVRSWGNLDAPAFTLCELTRFRAPSNPDVESTPFDVEHPAQSGLAIVREQRRHKFASRTAAPLNALARIEDRQDAGVQVVHGFCQHTWVDRDGVHVKVLERWDDK